MYKYSSTCSSSTKCFLRPSSLRGTSRPYHSHSLSHTTRPYVPLYCSKWLIHRTRSGLLYVKARYSRSDIKNPRLVNETHFDPGSRRLCDTKWVPSVSAWNCPSDSNFFFPPGVARCSLLIWCAVQYVRVLYLISASSGSAPIKITKDTGGFLGKTLSNGGFIRSHWTKSSHMALDITKGET